LISIEICEAIYSEDVMAPVRVSSVCSL